MRRLLTLSILFLICRAAFAPGLKQFYISESDPINFYDPLIRAVVQVESKGDPLAINITEQAIGAFQIRQCRIAYYNKLKGTNYKLMDCFNYELSRDIFLFFASGKSYEKAAKDWNGSGLMTVTYWDKVLKQLQTK